MKWSHVSEIIYKATGVIPPRWSDGKVLRGALAALSAYAGCPCEEHKKDAGDMCSLYGETMRRMVPARGDRVARRVSLLMIVVAVSACALMSSNGGWIESVGCVLLGATIASTDRVFSWVRAKASFVFSEMAVLRELQGSSETASESESREAASSA